MSREVSLYRTSLPTPEAELSLLAWRERRGYGASWHCERCGQRGALARPAATLEEALAQVASEAGALHPQHARTPAARRTAHVD